ncbi:hypothetical protein WJX84_011400, partial [Apatococcus fuscideae]
MKLESVLMSGPSLSWVHARVDHRVSSHQSASRDVKCQSKRTAAFREARQQHRLQASSSAEPDELAEKFFQGQYPEEADLAGEEVSLPDILGRMEGAAEQAEPAGPRSDVNDDFGWTQRMEPERAYLVGVQLKERGSKNRFAYDVHESLEELGRLAATAGLEVVGSTHQQLEMHNPKTYIGSGKIQELVAAVEESGAETLVVDDELTPGQLRSLDEAFQDRIRLCDRTALILDIFSQRAATREGQLQ